MWLKPLKAISGILETPLDTFNFRLYDVPRRPCWVCGDFSLSHLETAVKNFAAFLFVVGMIGAALAALAGYVMNIISLTQVDFTTIDGMEVCRLIGVFVPFVGAIAGWM